MGGAHLRAPNSQPIERGVVGGIGTVVHGRQQLNQQEIKRNELESSLNRNEIQKSPNVPANPNPKSTCLPLAMAAESSTSPRRPPSWALQRPAAATARGGGCYGFGGGNGAAVAVSGAAHREGKLNPNWSGSTILTTAEWAPPLRLTGAHPLRPDIATSAERWGRDVSTAVNLPQIEF
jgi:hypothetical protein